MAPDQRAPIYANEPTFGSSPKRKMNLTLVQVQNLRYQRHPVHGHPAANLLV